LNESQIQCNQLAEDNDQLIEQLRLQREELEAEKLANAEVIEIELSFHLSIIILPSFS
jgi:hypothetical protein